VVVEAEYEAALKVYAQPVQIDNELMVERRIVEALASVGETALRYGLKAGTVTPGGAVDWSLGRKRGIGM
jgi:hypothetical protein